MAATASLPAFITGGQLWTPGVSAIIPASSSRWTMVRARTAGSEPTVIFPWRSK